MNLAALAHLDHLVVVVIFDCWQLFGKCTRAGGVTGAWWLLTKRAVGSDEVVLIAPVIEADLAVGK